MFIEDEEIELALNILKGARAKNRINREFAAINELPCFKGIDSDKLATSRIGGVSLLDHKNVLSDAKLKAELVSVVLDLCMGKDLMDGTTGTGDVEETEDEPKKDGIEEEDSTIHDIRSVTALAIMCYNRSGQCAGLQKLVGLHFQGCGLKDMELNMLDRMGISVSPSALDKVREDLKAKSAQRISDIAKSGNVVVAYTTSKWRHRLNVERSNQLQILLCSRPLICPLVDFVPKSIREVLIHWALEETFPMTYEKKFGKRPSLPNISRLETTTMNYTPLTSLTGNKSTVDGALEIVRQIYREQLKDMPTEEYLGRMLVMGDPETTQGLRVGKFYQDSCSSCSPFCDLQWSIPMPGLFHLKMHALKFICDQHYGGQTDASKVQHHAEYITKYFVDPEETKKFYETESLCQRSYNARVAAMVFPAFSPDKSSNLEEYFASLSKEAVERSIAKLMSCISFERIGRPHYRPELGSHYAFLEHMEAYLILRYGVKFGDIGLISEAVSRLLCYFSATGDTRYAKEMVYLKLLTNSSAMKPCGQRAVLSGYLVNLRGEEDSWFETDRLVKLLNGHIKEVMKAK
ncbi:hypothetical protein TRVA0_035S00936 [Trichomonascus vanleenenianus]|uniref:uncharacterized protein n=1 Tax=Trichomonascus vanleenenianus TaxID=2268995 RepID=UPI003EC9A688